MKSLVSFNQRILKLALSSTLILGAATMSGSSVAASVTSTVTVDATLTAACYVTPTAAIHFASITNLWNAGVQTMNSGSTFRVACSNGTLPTIYSVGTRAMLKDLDADHPLVYTLSLDAAGLVDLPAVPGASAPDITLDGTLQDVPLYARILAADLQGLPSGTYTQPLTVTVDY